MKRKKSKGWKWSCGWSTSWFGYWHPDYEGCSARSRNPFQSEDRARKAAEKHMKTHGHHGTYCNCHSHAVNVWEE